MSQRTRRWVWAIAHLLRDIMHLFTSRLRYCRAVPQSERNCELRDVQCSGNVGLFGRFSALGKGVLHNGWGLALSATIKRRWYHFSAKGEKVSSGFRGPAVVAA